MKDKEFRQDVIAELDFDPRFDAAHVGVAVEKSVVTSSGYADGYAKKLAAVAAARRVRGVHAIADEIEVRYPFQSELDDHQIAKRAINILSRTRSFLHIRSTSSWSPAGSRFAKSFFGKAVRDLRVPDEFRVSASSPEMIVIT